MTTLNYCRRETDGKPCGLAIDAANALGWCPSCRERLPFWPTDTKEVRIESPEALSLFGEAVREEVR